MGVKRVVVDDEAIALIIREGTLASIKTPLGKTAEEMVLELRSKSLLDDVQ